jgi:hypothetical protein
VVHRPSDGYPGWVAVPDEATDPGDQGRYYSAQVFFVSLFGVDGGSQPRGQVPDEVGEIGTAPVAADNQQRAKVFGLEGIIKLIG